VRKTAGQAVSVLVADPEPVARAGLTTAISRQPDLTVVGAIEDGSEALESIRSLEPAVAVIGARTPRLSGLQVLEAITGEQLRSRVVLIAAQVSGLEVQDAMVAGASGYLSKSEPLDTIWEAIREAARGRQYLSPKSQAALVAQMRRSAHRQELLSKREVEILKLTAEGVTSAGIGRRLNLSQSTVKNHQQNLYGKLGVHNAPAAIYQAMRRGLLR
jgi:DNA-binding NarL/FixJ family response regulator